MATVYFDTCFYLGLGAADATTADSVIQRVEELSARPAISLQLVQELTANEGPNDRRMVERIDRLPAPVSLEHGLTWERLRMPQDPGYAAWRDTTTTRIAGISALARRGATNEQAAEIAAQVGFAVPTSPQEASDLVASLVTGQMDVRAILLQLGCDPSSLGFGHGPVTMRGLFDRLGLDYAALFGFGDGPPQADDMKRWGEEKRRQLEDAFPQETGDIHAAQRFIDADVSRSQALPDVALGRASRAAASRFSGHVKDADHMATVLRYREVIGFVQIDLKRYSKMCADPGYPLRELGIENICFAGKDLNGMIDALALLIRR